MPDTTVKGRPQLHPTEDAPNANKETTKQCIDCKNEFFISKDTETPLTDEQKESCQRLLEKKNQTQTSQENETFHCKNCIEQQTAVPASLPGALIHVSRRLLGGTMFVIVVLTAVTFSPVYTDVKDTVMDYASDRFYWFTRNRDIPYIKEQPSPEMTKLEDDLLKLEEMFPKQDEDTWIVLTAGIKSVKRTQPNQPSVFLMLYESEAAGKTAECIAKEVSERASTFLKKQIKKPVVYYGPNLNKDKLLRDPGLFLVEMNNTVRDSGSMVVVNLHDVPPTVAKEFHFVCDKYSPLVETAIYFFTFKVDKITRGKLQHKAEEALEKLWSLKLEDHLMRPLITRITTNVINIYPDSHNC